MKSYNVYLASVSPRRAELIKKIPWLNAAVFPSCAKEPPYSGGDATEYACSLAELKALDVLGKKGGVVIGADTVVALDGRVFGKPRSTADAEMMFKLLCGRTHEVITGVCVACKDKILTDFEKTYVTFGAFVDKIVYNYINSGAPFDKAGGYGFQDCELKPLIEKIEGNEDNVIGLPVRTLEKMLRSFSEWL